MLTPVRASISTPVLPDDLTVTDAITDLSCPLSKKSTSTASIKRLWHNGINDDVDFTACTAAIFAVARASPLIESPLSTISNASLPRQIVPLAFAVLIVISLLLTSIIPSDLFIYDQPPIFCIWNPFAGELSLV